MTPTKLLVGQIFVVFAIVILGVWSATQWAASMLGYQAQLGLPWGSEVRGLHEGLTAAAEAEGAAFDEEAEGGLQQQRHPGLPEEQASKPIEREQDAAPGDDDDSDPAADRRAMTSLSNVARAVAMNEGKSRGKDILPSFGGDD